MTPQTPAPDAPTRIFRYEVPVDDQVHTIELCGDPLGVGSRTPAVVEFWAYQNDDYPPRRRRFTVVGTGHPVPDDFAHHWGYAYASGGALVWHLIEVAS